MANNNLPDINIVSADDSTILAAMRTRLAADRTLMSWFRTSLALISFGFTIIKFFEYLKYFTAITIAIPSTGIQRLGLSLIILGTFALIPAILEYRKQVRIVKNIGGVGANRYVIIISCCVGLIGLYTLLNVLEIIDVY